MKLAIIGVMVVALPVIVFVAGCTTQPKVDMSIKVVDRVTIPAVAGEAAAPGYNWQLVQITATNTGNLPFNWTDLQFYVAGSSPNDKYYEKPEIALVGQNDVYHWLGWNTTGLQPQQSETGTVAFQTPQNFNIKTIGCTSTKGFNVETLV